MAALRGGPEFRGWGIHEYLTASLIDSVNDVAYAVVAANSKKKPKAPQPFPRPEQTVNSRRGAGSFAAMATSLLQSAKERKAQGNGEGTGR
jgi:hypothetical protein